MATLSSTAPVRLTHEPQRSSRRREHRAPDLSLDEERLKYEDARFAFLTAEWGRLPSDRHEREVAVLRRRVRQLGAEVRKMQDDKMRMSERLAQAKSDHRERYVRLERELIGVRGKYESERARQDARLADVARLAGKKEALQTEVVTLEKKTSVSSSAEATGALTRVHAELAEQGRRMEETRGKMMTLREMERQMEGKLARWKKAQKDKKKRAKDVVEIRDEIEKAEAEKSDLERRVAVIETESVSEIQSDIDRWTRELNRLLSAHREKTIMKAQLSRESDK